MQAAQASLLPDGRRLHLHHGPIDLIVEAWETGNGTRDAAYAAAVARFDTILQELVDELPALRAEANAERIFDGPTARRMQAAVAPYAGETFVTPMAAVAGAVADEILVALTAGADLTKAYVNNGGDTAFHLGEGEHITAALATDDGQLPGRIDITAADPFRGVATSGWRGRSHSLGIADSVSVVAQTAAAADVAATLIANAVDLPGHPAIERTPACELSPDSDLGVQLVTTNVGNLDGVEVEAALAAGTDFATSLIGTGRIAGALLSLSSAVAHVGLADQIRMPERTLLDA